MLYLETGNLSEINKMNYWEFRAILKTFEKKLAIQSGKSYIERGLPQSSKDMITKRKAQR